MKTHVRILLQSAGLHLPAIDNEDNRHLVGWFVGLALALWFSVGWAFVATFYTIDEITHGYH